MKYIKHIALVFLLGLIATANANAQTFTRYQDTLNLDEYTNLEEAMKEPDKVRRLVLKNKKLKEIPAEIFLFKNLVELDLRGNKIKSIPPAIANLTKLRYLNLSRNDIDSIPAAFGELKSLVYVELGQNAISYIAPQFKQLTSLEYISLWENELTYIPECSNLNIKELDLRSIIITASQREQIKDALPEKTIIYFSPDCNCGK